MKFRRKHSIAGDAEIPLTSMTDIMFLLLIFFMVSTTFQVSSGIQVKLPAASAQMREGEAQRAVISISEDGKIFFNNNEVDDSALEKALQEAAAKNADTLIVIRADKNVTHGRVVAVMDDARRAGLERIAIATVQKGAR